MLPREEVVRLLRIDGDFLVRETTRNDESQTVLSVCWNGHKHFIVQITAEVNNGDAMRMTYIYFICILGPLPIRRAELSKYPRIDFASVPIWNTRYEP